MNLIQETTRSYRGRKKKRRIFSIFPKFYIQQKYPLKIEEKLTRFQAPIKVKWIHC